MKYVVTLLAVLLAAAIAQTGQADDSWNAGVQGMSNLFTPPQPIRIERQGQVPNTNPWAGQVQPAPVYVPPPVYVPSCEIITWEDPITGVLRYRKVCF